MSRYIDADRCEYCKCGKEFIKAKIIHVAYPIDMELPVNFCPVCGADMRGEEE